MSESNDPPSYEDVYPAGVLNGMCAMECGSHWTGIVDNNMSVCTVSVLIKAMKRIIYDFLEKCDDKNMVDIDNTYMCCNGEVYSNLVRRGPLLPARMGGGSMNLNKKETEITNALTTVMKKWNAVRTKMYNETCDRTGSPNEGMILFGSECMNIVTNVHLNLIEDQDMVESIAEYMILYRYEGREVRTNPFTAWN